MQIHELNTFSGTLNDSVYLAVDNGADTTKIPATEFAEAVDNAKVNLPTDIYDQPTYGTAGQVLRTKGDGETEWANVGQPTDAQTAQAVSNWLDAHPEATTTVEDYSLTNKKLVLGTLDFVTPEMFGAIGDGVTDDTDAFQAALSYGGMIICKAGSTYNITDTLRVKADTTLLLYGATITTAIRHLFYNFLDTDTFTGYDGNGNISIKGGSVIGGSIAFIHGKNILIDGVRWSDCKNDHYFEICACKNFTVRNCSFVGMSTIATSRKEYINIDNCTSGNFPHFSDPTNPTYDLTVVDGVLVENCYFDISNGVMEDAVGKHAYADDGDLSAYKAKNITIRNCKVVGATEIAFLLLGVENVLVESCYMDGCTAITNCRNSNNVTIRNNIAKGVTTYCKTENLSGFFFVGNYVETSAISAINNQGTSNIVEIRDNTLRSSSSTPTLLRLYSGTITITHLTIYNNALEYSGARKTITDIAAAVTASCQVDIADYIKFWNGSALTATNSAFDLTDFNCLIIQFGAANEGTLREMRFKSYAGSNFAINGVFRFLWVDTDDSVNVGTITITDAHTITATGINMRNVIMQALPRT